MRASSFFVVALCAAACTRSSETSSTQTTSASSGTITMKGSDTMVILGQRWAERYMKENPGTTVQVTGGGSGTGIAALINGSTDICQSSRPMKDKEKAEVLAKRKAEAVETPVALDALAIYVNEKNPIREIAIPTLRRIYLGQVVSWKDVGGPDHAIVLYGRENNSGTYGYFKEHVLENKDFAAATQTLAGTSAVANAVKGDVYGIGYGGVAYLQGIRALDVKKEEHSPAIAPSLETVRDSSYPLSRSLYFYTAGPPVGPTKKLVDWVLGPAGQAVIADVGYFPLVKR